MKKVDMSNKFIKDNGVHYTPEELSFYMSKILVNEFIKNNSNEKIKVMDPACGDGELLLSLAIELQKNNISFEMYGIDTNLDELKIAEKRLSDIGIQLQTNNGDYIDNYNNFTNFDLIIANPPYVRTQNMENNKRNNKNNFAVNGRFDLYQLFFNALTYSLKYDGILCIITSNKFMFNKAGQKTRELLLNNYNIKFVLDLGDSKMFEASVLPAIFLGKKELSTNNTYIPSAKIYETTDYETSNLSIFDALLSNEDSIVVKDNHNYKIGFGHIDVRGKGDIWAITTSSELSFIDFVNKNKYCCLSDWANVKVGIKTTADKVFIKNQLEDFNISDKSLIHEMIFSKNTKKWAKDKKKKRFILYPYTIKNNTQNVIDLENYPSVKEYFIENEEILKSRKYFENSKKKWFEIWVCHNLLDFKKPKIVVPDISSEPKFLYDNNSLVDGNCYWITLKENIPDDYLFLILGLCNSKFMEQYHDFSFQNKLYSGKRRYVSQYINKYPMIDPNSQEANNIILAVKEILNNNLCDTEQKEDEIEKNINDYWRCTTNE